MIQHPKPFTIGGQTYIDLEIEPLLHQIQLEHGPVLGTLAHQPAQGRSKETWQVVPSGEVFTSWGIAVARLEAWYWRHQYAPAPVDPAPIPEPVPESVMAEPILTPETPPAKRNRPAFDTPPEGWITLREYTRLTHRPLSSVGAAALSGALPSVWVKRPTGAPMRYVAPPSLPAVAESIPPPTIEAAPVPVELPPAPVEAAAAEQSPPVPSEAPGLDAVWARLQSERDYLRGEVSRLQAARLDDAEYIGALKERIRQLEAAPVPSTNGHSEHAPSFWARLVGQGT